MESSAVPATSLSSLIMLSILLQVVGIDLGTTNSAVAAMEGGKPTIVTNAEGMFLLPLRTCSVTRCLVRPDVCRVHTEVELVASVWTNRDDSLSFCIRDRTFSQHLFTALLEHHQVGGGTVSQALSSMGSLSFGA